MSIAAPNYAKFAEQAVANDRVFSFVEEAGFLVYKIHGHDVVPVWSSESRLRRIQKEHPKYQKYQITSMSVAEFLDWLPDLEGENIRLGVNWAGKHLTGYDVEPESVRAMLHYQMSKRPRILKGPWPETPAN